MIAIGLPKALFYFQHHILWENFFKNLGCSVVVSPDTNKEILDWGVKYGSNEICLPVKVFIGHVRYLRDRVDFIFVPRYTSLDKNEYTCPKFCGLPEMAAFSMDEGPGFIEIHIHADKAPEEAYIYLKKIAKILNCKYKFVVEAFMSAIEVYRIEIKKKEAALKQIAADEPVITVLGHPYVINDDYLSMRLIQKLRQNHYKICTPADLTHDVKRANAYPYQGRVFWETGIDNLGSAFSFYQKGNVKGVIYLTPFGCGIDSFVTEFIERKLVANSSIHYMKLTIDEHTGETGFDTRIEAFLDMMGEGA